MKINIKIKHRIAGMVGLFSLVLLITTCQFNSKIKTLVIIPDQNGQECSEILGTILEKTNHFKIQYADASDPSLFKPKFGKYDLIVLSGSGRNWPGDLQSALVTFVLEGGGVVFHHYTPQTFDEWDAFTELTGIGGWGMSDQSEVVYLFEKDPKWTDTIEITGSNETGPYAYVVSNVAEHPVTQGLPARWMHETDILFNYLQGPGSNFELLATAYSDTAFNGSGRYEPVLFVNTYGAGRIFHTAMAHDQSAFPEAFQCTGFIVTLQRGAEWAATGSVTQSLPVDFPNSVSTMAWPNYVPMTLEELFTRASGYDYEKSRKYLSDISERIRRANRNHEDLTTYENRIIAFLNSDATAESKNYIMQELSWMGTEACISTLKELAGQEETGEMARFAVERLTSRQETGK